MPSPFPCSPVICEFLWKKTQIEKKKKKKKKIIFHFKQKILNFGTKFAPKGISGQKPQKWTSPLISTYSN